jgi:hypothetical protein
MGGKGGTPGQHSELYAEAVTAPQANIEGGAGAGVVLHESCGGGRFRDEVGGG